MSPPTIGTPDMRFKGGDVTACALLKMVPRYKEARIVRTSDESVLVKSWWHLLL